MGTIASRFTRIKAVATVLPAAETVSRTAKLSSPVASLASATTRKPPASTSGVKRNSAR